MKSALHIIRDLDPRSGGMSVSVPMLALAVADTGRYFQRLVCFSKPGGYAAPVLRGVETIQLQWHPLGLRLGRIDPLLAHVLAQSDVVHIHGVWQAHCTAVGSLCRKLDKPYMVSAHGMLDEWALHNKSWKKAPYSALFERRNLNCAACLRALTAGELDDYRAYGLDSPVTVIPNGVNPDPAVAAESIYGSFPELAGKRVILFLSRVHYKKGVDILCRAFAALEKDFPDAILVFAGPDYEGTMARLDALVRRLGIRDKVTYTGMLEGDKKWAALAASEVFVLPSHSEGFSVAVLEALATGRPVIITPGCYFPEVGETGSGLIVDASDAEVERALRTVLAMSPEDRAAMGSRGQRLVQTSYSWPAIGERLAHVYDWLLGVSPRPEDVFMRLPDAQAATE